MVALGNVRIELKVVLGSARLPIRQMLRLGRGATIPLDSTTEDLSELQVDAMPFAKGRIHVDGDRMSFEVAQLCRPGSPSHG